FKVHLDGSADRVPGQRSAARKRAPRLAANDLLEVARQQAIAGTDDAQIVWGERLAGADVAHDIDRTAEDEAFLLHLRARRRAGPECREGRPGTADQSPQFVWFE